MKTSGERKLVQLEKELTDTKTIIEDQLRRLGTPKLRTLALASKYLDLEVAISVQEGYGEPFPNFPKSGRWALRIAVGSFFIIILSHWAIIIWLKLDSWFSLISSIALIVLTLAFLFSVFTLSYAPLRREVNAYRHRDKDMLIADYLTAKFAPAVCKRLVTKNEQIATLIFGLKGLAAVTALGSMHGLSNLVFIDSPLSWNYLEIVALVILFAPAWNIWRNASLAADIAAASAD